MDWPRLIFLGMEWNWLLFGLACLGWAGTLVVRPELVGKVSARLETPRGAALARRVALVVVAAWIPAWVIAFKLAQYRSYQLMWDFGVMANVAWNTAHGYGLTSSVIADRSYLSVHFLFAAPLVSPVLWLWNSAAALAFVYGALMGSSILAAYLLAQERLNSRPLAWLVAALALAQPFYHDLVGAVVDSAFSAPLSLWAMYFWATKRWTAGAACLLFLLSTGEEMPFILLGVGCFWIVQGGRRTRWGGALALGSVLLWLAETWIVKRSQAGWTPPINYWGLFTALGGSKEAILAAATHHPWTLAAALVAPAEKLLMPLSIAFRFALLPLASGTAMIPALVVLLPHQLADAPTGYHRLIAHTSDCLYGPLIFATIVGLERTLARFKGKHGRWVCAYVLATAGFLMIRYGNFMLPAGLIPTSWEIAGPRALAAIPPDASVWCDEFFLPQLALRRHVKTLPRKLPDGYFEPGLFLPDRVLLSLHWSRFAEPETRARIVTFLKSKGYSPMFQEKDLVVLARKRELDAAPEPVVVP
ncbi:MAG: DUF2079 domain-containing protein [Elusimicrobia bacterium]|nr:DUF2079 domain-containing protein [Elusimicrobiota bacterium]